MARGGKGSQAESYVVEQIGLLPGWNARNANDTTINQPGFDVVATNDAMGCKILVSVKSVSQGGARQDYGIGSSFERHRADIYAFVDMTGERPGPVCLAGTDTIVELARARHRKYQTDRGRPDSLNSWSPKISRGLLEAMGALDAWHILDHPAPAAWPPLTDELLSHARSDAPRPRGT